MMNLTVRQHIFGNVPKEQSPRGRRGFQTLFHSPDLTAEDVLLLEERAQYFYRDDGPVKHQFYTLAGGQAVVTQIVAIPEPDEYGRKGRYLAHSLIVPADTFRQMAYCPLPLVAPRYFIADMAAALAAGDRSGTAPPKTIAIPDADVWASQTLALARQWPAADLEALARLGWRAAGLRADRQTVALVGNSEAILAALGVCFLLCPPAKRPALTFDTYAYRADWSRGWPFWALAGLEDDAQAATYRIDAAARRVHGRLPDADDTPFEHWIARQAIPERLEYFSIDEQDALRLDAVLAGKPGGPARVDPAFGERFARLNAETVAGQVLARLPAAMGETRRQQVQRRVRSQPWTYLARLAQGFGAREAAAELAGVELALVQARAPLAEGEMRALQELAATAGVEELNSLALLRDKDRDAWRRSLARLSEGSYRRIAEAAVSSGFIAAGDAFVVEHLPAWAELAALTLRPGELKGVLRVIDKQGGELDVDALQAVWPALNDDDRRLLADWIRRYPGPAPGFRAALGAPEPFARSLRDRLRLPFARKPDGGEE